MDYIKAFIIGGLICAIVQILIDKTKLMPGRIMVVRVVLGSILSSIGIFEPLKNFAGAGVTVPLLGFGDVLYTGVKEAIDEMGFLGIFKGGLTAGALGTSSALIFGYISSLFFDSKMPE